MTLEYNRLVVMYDSFRPIAGVAKSETLRDLATRIPRSKKNAWQEGKLCYIELNGPEQGSTRLFTVDTSKALAIIEAEIRSERYSHYSERTLALRELRPGIWFPVELSYVETDLLDGQSAYSSSAEKHRGQQVLPR